MPKARHARGCRAARLPSDTNNAHVIRIICAHAQCAWFKRHGCILASGSIDNILSMVGATQLVSCSRHMARMHVVIREIGLGVVLVTSAAYTLCIRDNNIWYQQRLS